MTDSQPSSPPCGQVPCATPDVELVLQKLTVCNDHPVPDASEEGLPGDSESEAGTSSSSEESLQVPCNPDESCIVAICGPEGFWAGQVHSFKQLNAMVARGGKVLPSDDETIEALASLRRVIRCSAAGPWEAAIGNFNPLTLEELPTSDTPPRPLIEDGLYSDVDVDDDDDDESGSDFSAGESSSSADFESTAGDSSSESSFDDTNALGEDSDEDNSEPESDDAEDLSDCGTDVVEACRLARIRHDHEQKKRLARAAKKARETSDDIKIIRTIPQTQLTPPKGKRDNHRDSPPKVPPKKKRIQIFSSQEK